MVSWFRMTEVSPLGAITFGAREVGWAVTSGVALSHIEVARARPYRAHLPGSMPLPPSGGVPRVERSGRDVSP